MPRERRTNRVVEETEVRLRHNGPYLARIVSVLDPKFMGALQVELLKNDASGNLPETDGQLFTVHYLSPFYGVTPVSANGMNDTYQESQQSYGWWAVPPDPGTKVMVIFLESSASRGFWIGCVPDEYMNFMIPDGRPATTYNSTGEMLPVGEFNKNTITNPNNNPNTHNKPVNEYFVDVLTTQGLLEDSTRGLTSSSARREAPSQVFGFSSPGPYDKTSPRNPVGIDQSRGLMYTSRLGGSSIVFDDGDDKFIRVGPASVAPKEYLDLENASEDLPPGDPTIPANELVRIRTRTGHQILLHNSEDLIYIGNSKGSTWIELTSNGKIDIYAKDSISIHTEEDLNFSADRDINFYAGENINVNSGKNFNNTVGGSYSLKSADFVSVLSGTSLSLKASEYVSSIAGTSQTVQSLGGATNIVSQGDAYLVSTSAVNIKADGLMNLNAKGDMNLKIDGTYLLKSQTSNMYSDGGTFVTSDGSMHLKSNTAQFIESAASFNLKSGVNLYIDSGATTNIKAGGAINQQSGAGLNLTAGATLNVDGGSEVQINGGARVQANPATEATVAAVASEPGYPEPQDAAPPFEAPIPSRIPQHEPWLQHENLNPSEYTPDKTRAGTPPVDSFAADTGDTYRNIDGRQTTVNRTVTSYRPQQPTSTTGREPETEELDYEGGLGVSAQGPIGPLLALIRRAESNNNYNAIWGGITLPPPQTLTTMTIGDVLSWQALATSSAHPQRYQPTSSAAGAYQYIQGTLRTTFPRAGLSSTDLYNVENQDAICTATLENECDLSEFRAGNITLEQFGNNIARIWAAFPVFTPIRAGATGRYPVRNLQPGDSYYLGVGENGARLSLSEVAEVLQAMRSSSQETQPDAASGDGSSGSAAGGGTDTSAPPSSSEPYTGPSTNALPPGDPGNSSLGMIGGVRGDGGFYQSLTGSGLAHASNPEYTDYSQLYREYTFEERPGYVPVGARDGRTVYAAPDYLRDESGNYVSVSSAEYRRIAARNNALVPTREEVTALIEAATPITMPTQPIGTTGGSGDPVAYTREVERRLAEQGIAPGTPIIHGKEFYNPSGYSTVPAPRGGSAPPPSPTASQLPAPLTDTPTGGMNPSSGRVRVFYDYSIEDKRTVPVSELRNRTRGNGRTTIRSLRVQERLFQILNDAANATGIEEVRIYSGGQITEDEARRMGATQRGSTWWVGTPERGQGVRTGSTRHNNGRAADLYLKVNDQILYANRERDRQYMIAFFEKAAELGLLTAAHPYMGQQNFHVDIVPNVAHHYTYDGIPTSQWLIDAVNAGKRRRGSTS